MSLLRTMLTHPGPSAKAFVAIGNTATGGPTLNVQVPAARVAGDTLIMAVSWFAAAGTGSTYVTPPIGWTVLDHVFYYHPSFLNWRGLTVFAKTATGSEGSTISTGVSPGGGSFGAGSVAFMLCYRGLGAVSNVVSRVVAGGAGVLKLAYGPAGAGSYPTTAGQTLIGIGTGSGNNTASPYSSPVGYTERRDATSSDTNANRHSLQVIERNPTTGAEVGEDTTSTLHISGAAITTTLIY